MAPAAAAAMAAAAGLGPYMLQLSEVVDEVETMTFLAEIYNHLPMFQSAVFNMETGQQGTPTPQHRLEVARRLQLTPWQVMILKMMLFA
jgi:hypothetical protein